MAQPRPPVALVLDPGHGGRTPTDWELAPADLRALLRSGKLLRHVLRHPSARLLVDDIEGRLRLCRRCGWHAGRQRCC